MLGVDSSSPAIYWESKYCPVDIICVDTNNKELRIALEHRNGILDPRYALAKAVHFYVLTRLLD